MPNRVQEGLSHRVPLRDQLRSRAEVHHCAGSRGEEGAPRELRVCAPARVQAGAQGEGGVQAEAGVQDCQRPPVQGGVQARLQLQPTLS